MGGRSSVNFEKIRKSKRTYRSRVPRVNSTLRDKRPKGEKYDHLDDQ